MATEVVSNYDLETLDAEFDRLDALDIIDWAAREFGDDLAVSSSFGADSAVMLHLATHVKPDIKVIVVDTGFLFPATTAFRDELAKRMKLNLHVYRPKTPREEFIKE